MQARSRGVECLTFRSLGLVSFGAGQPCLCRSRPTRHVVGAGGELRRSASAPAVFGVNADRAGVGECLLLQLGF